MIDQTDFLPAFKAKLTEVEGQFEAKAAEVAAARQAAKEADGAAFKAAARFGHFNLVILQACRHSIDGVPLGIGSEERMLSLATGPIDELAHAELQLKQSADLELTKAQKRLKNLEWQLGNLRDSIAQLRQCITPAPDAPRKLEVAPRPARPEVDDLDDIILPPARSVA
jgi:hypothetical protein